MNIDEQILAASHDLREAHANHRQALASLDTARQRVKELEKGAEASLKAQQAAEKRLRDIAAGNDEAMSMTSRTVNV